MKFIDYIENFWEVHQNCVMVDKNRTKLAIIEKSDIVMTSDEVYKLACDSFPNLDIRCYFDSDVTKITGDLIYEMGGYPKLKSNAINLICGGDLEWVIGNVFVAEKDAYGRDKFDSSFDADYGLELAAVGKIVEMKVGIKCSIFGSYYFAPYELHSVADDISFYAQKVWNIEEKLITEKIKKSINDYD